MEIEEGKCRGEKVEEMEDEEKRKKIIEDESGMNVEWKEGIGKVEIEDNIRKK